jgi:hypothetical protein
MSMVCGILRMWKRSPASMAWRTASRVLVDVIRFVSLGFRSRSQLAAENLFLTRKPAVSGRRLKAAVCESKSASRLPSIFS